MRRVEVRCCCNAAKLLGTLPLPDNARTWAFPVMRESNANFVRAAARGPLVDKVILELAPWRDELIDPVTQRFTVIGGEALKADGIPIETLRRIPGFIEATPPPPFMKD